MTTRRTQGAEKALVPTWNDSVSKLPGVGKETFNKLKDLQGAGLTYPLADYRIATGDSPCDSLAVALLWVPEQASARDTLTEFSPRRPSPRRQHQCSLA